MPQSPGEAALGLHIVQQWDWDEELQREVHDLRLREQQLCQIELNGQPIATVSRQSLTLYGIRSLVEQPGLKRLTVMDADGTTTI
ncbi:hypothetical protein DXT98_29815 [Agrobacterium sp. ICMP 7243]|jgi:hypothetical protein|nr:hypothetical protein DXT98_29815 [Agrobacterium sp. ICMP 7243]